MIEDIGSERAVMAGIAKYGYSAWIDISDILSTNSFTIESNQVLFKCFEQIFSKGECVVDVPTILAAANDIGLPEWFGEDRHGTEEKKYLRSVFNFPIERDSVRILAGRLKKLEISRHIKTEIQKIDELLDNLTGNESLSEILSMVESPIFDLTNTLGSNESEYSYIGEGAEEYWEYLKANPNTIPGLSSGLPIWDDLIGGGLRRGSVNVIVARMKQGKSSIGINVAANLIKSQNIPVCFMDLELQKEDFWAKLWANQSGVDITKIERFSLTREEENKVCLAKDYIKQWPLIYCNISNKSFTESVGLTRRMLLKEVGKREDGKLKDCLVIYDYLRLNDSELLNKNLMETQALGFQIIALKQLALHLNVPILTFVQANRDGITGEDTDIVAGSDRIGMICNNLSLFKSKSEEEIADDRASNKAITNRKLKVLFTRHGGGHEQPGDYINIKFDKKIARIYEMGTRSNPVINNKPQGFISEQSDITFNP